MRLHRFYVKEKLNSHPKLTITDEALIHQWKDVFRLSGGDRVILFDGSGTDHTYSFDVLSKNSTELSFIESHPTPALLREVWLCVALIKKDLFELVVEKGTELGVTHFVPILSERAIKKELNMERLQKIALEATEQSGRGTPPTIHERMDLSKAIGMVEDAQKIVFDPTGEVFSNAIFTTDRAVRLALFVGPEGGWTEKELVLFKEQNARITSLGNQILRAETAAIAAATLTYTAQ